MCTGGNKNGTDYTMIVAACMDNDLPPVGLSEGYVHITPFGDGTYFIYGTAHQTDVRIRKLLQTRVFSALVS